MLAERPPVRLNTPSFRAMSTPTDQNELPLAPGAASTSISVVKYRLIAGWSHTLPSKLLPNLPNSCQYKYRAPMYRSLLTLTLQSPKSSHSVRSPKVLTDHTYISVGLHIAEETMSTRYQWLACSRRNDWLHLLLIAAPTNLSAYCESRGTSTTSSRTATFSSSGDTVIVTGAAAIVLYQQSRSSVPERVDVRVSDDSSPREPLEV